MFNGMRCDQSDEAGDLIRPMNCTSDPYDDKGRSDISDELNT